MRLKLVLAALLLGAVLVSGPGVATAAQKKPNEIAKCVREKVQSHQEASADDCVNSPSPLTPSLNEVVWGTIAFVVLFVALARWAYPPLKRMMETRTERIRSNLDDAERVKGEAQSILEDYQRQLADARGEAGRIIEEARQTADAMRRDLMRRAEEEAAQVRQRAQEDIQAQVDRAMADLRHRVAELSIELAEKVVERSLDRETQLSLVESYIAQVGATPT